MDTKQIDQFVRAAIGPAASKIKPVVREQRRMRVGRRLMGFGPDAADASLLGLRLTFGGYLAGHGAQKLFGLFGGEGPHETGEHFEQLGLAPGTAMSIVAGATELAGGLLTATGVASPLGPLMSASTMAVAAGTAHQGKGAFAQTGGPELPLTDLAAAAVLAAVGPGRFSLDRFVGMRLPERLSRAVVATGVTLVAVLVVRSAVRRRAARADDGRGDVQPDAAATSAPVRGRQPEATARTG